METTARVVTDSMVGLSLPDYCRHSPRVAFVLGKNPGPFTGPGTNTYLLGTGRRPILLDTGQGVPVYADLLQAGLAELCRSEELDRIVLTHAHPDHIGGVSQVRRRYGEIAVIKKPWPGYPGEAQIELTAVDEAAVIVGEGITLRAIFTPGHAPDHLCYYLEEERALFTGDVVLGAGTTVIPDDTGDLGQYMASLRRLLELDLGVIYPAHGPAIREPYRKIREYIAHRELRERQILQVLKNGPLGVMDIVKRIYTDVPEFLHAAAASSVHSHLKKLHNEGVAMKHDDLWAVE